MRGCSLCAALDAYDRVEDDFVNNAETLRADAFLVNGPSDLEHVASASVLRALLPQHRKERSHV